MCPLSDVLFADIKENAATEERSIKRARRIRKAASTKMPWMPAMATCTSTPQTWQQLQPASCWRTFGRTAATGLSWSREHALDVSVALSL